MGSYRAKDTYNPVIAHTYSPIAGLLGDLEEL